MVSNRIRQARKQMGKSQEEFAKLMSVHRVTLSDYERGVLTPSIETVEQVAQIVGKPMAWFFTTDEEAQPVVTREAALRVIGAAVRDADQADQLRTRVEEAESNLVQLSSALRKTAEAQKVALDPEVQALLDKYPDDPNRDRLLLWEQSANMPPIKPGSPELENVKKAARDDKKRGK